MAVSDDTGWFRLPLHQPANVISQNELLRASHTGQAWRITPWKEAWEQAAFYAWKEARSYDVFSALTATPCNVKLDLGFRANRKRDPHNYVSTVTKWVIDGLVYAGMWPDDNPEYVTVYEPILSVHKGLAKTAPLPCAVLFQLRENHGH